jgi:hypothetical protein
MESDWPMVLQVPTPNYLDLHSLPKRSGSSAEEQIASLSLGSRVAWVRNLFNLSSPMNRENDTLNTGRLEQDDGRKERGGGILGWEEFQMSDTPRLGLASRVFKQAGHRERQRVRPKTKGG